MFSQIVIGTRTWNIIKCYFQFWRTGCQFRPINCLFTDAAPHHATAASIFSVRAHMRIVSIWARRHQQRLCSSGSHHRLIIQRRQFKIPATLCSESQPQNYPEENVHHRSKCYENGIRMTDWLGKENFSSIERSMHKWTYRLPKRLHPNCLCRRHWNRASMAPWPQPERGWNKVMHSARNMPRRRPFWWISCDDLACETTIDHVRTNIESAMMKLSTKSIKCTAKVIRSRWAGTVASVKLKKIKIKIKWKKGRESRLGTNLQR